MHGTMNVKKQLRFWKRWRATVSFPESLEAHPFCALTVGKNVPLSKLFVSDCSRITTQVILNDEAFHNRSHLWRPTLTDRTEFWSEANSGRTLPGQMTANTAQFSGEKRNDRCTPAILLSRFGSSGRFFLFPKLKSALKGRRFDTIDKILKNSRNELFVIPKEAFQKAFQSWQKRWERCVASQGNYLESDKLE